MGDVLTLAIRRAGSCGTVVVWRKDDTQFEIGHESSSGNSWGQFTTFDDAESAVAAAYRLNRDVYGNACDVEVSPEVIACLPRTPGPVKGEF